MPDSTYDILVIGGGIIGLATCMRFTKQFPNVTIAVLEKERDIALHQTGHNSGVIHAGIYYSPGSQKANFCSTGGKQLRDFCEQRGIKFDMCGKVIVAVTKEEIPRLEDLYRRGIANGAQGLEMIDQERLREIEPYAAGVKAILSPNTGIIDFTEVSRAYADEILEHGGHLLTDTGVRSISRREGRLYLETTKGDVSARYIVNCAGLHADIVSQMMGVDTGVRIIPFRGEYFSVKPEKASMVNGLIYPVPDPRLPFLGVHFTRRINGSVEAGPNAVLAFAREGYSKTRINFGDMVGTLSYPGFWRMSGKYWKSGLNEQHRSLSKNVFVRSLQTLVPEITGNDLGDPGAGVRAQAVDRRGQLLQDFSIAQTRDAIHVINAPSPGATSSLSISQYIVAIAQESFGLHAA